MQKKIYLWVFVVFLLAQMVYASNLYSWIIGDYNYDGRSRSVMPPLANPAIGKEEEKTLGQNRDIIAPFRWERRQQPPPPPPPEPPTWKISIPLPFSDKVITISILKPRWLSSY